MARESRRSPPRRRAGAKSKAEGETYTSGLASGAKGKVGAEVAARAGGEVEGNSAVDVGGVTLLGIKGKAGGKSEARAGGNAEGEAKAGPGGVSAKGSIGGEAMARVSGEAMAQGAVAGVHSRSEAKGSLAVGGELGANGEIGVRAGNIGATGSAKAFAGVQAEGSVVLGIGFLGVDVFTSTLTAGVSAGVGGGIGGGIQVKDGVIIISLEALASLGVGGSLGGKVSIDLMAPFKSRSRRSAQP